MLAAVRRMEARRFHWTPEFAADEFALLRADS